MPVRALVHIRHGQTDWNAAARLQGSQDIPLNDTGRGQADRNGRVLAAHFEQLGRRPSEFAYVASPLMRARATMEIVRGRLSLDPTGYRVEPSLSEVSFGDFEGYSYADIAAVDPAAHERLRADKWHFLPPRGESYVMLHARVGRWLDTVEHETVVVSHGGVYRVLKALMSGVEDPQLAELFVPQDRISVWRDGTETWI